MAKGATMAEPVRHCVSDPACMCMWWRISFHATARWTHEMGAENLNVIHVILRVNLVNFFVVVWLSVFFRRRDDPGGPQKYPFRIRLLIFSPFPIGARFLFQVNGRKEKKEKNSRSGSCRESSVHWNSSSLKNGCSAVWAKSAILFLPVDGRDRTTHGNPPFTVSQMRKSWGQSHDCYV